MAFPQVGTSGTFIALEPYNLTVIPLKLYTVKAVRTFDELMRDGVDIYKEYYVVPSVGKDKIERELLYKSHILKQSAVVTLESSDGTIVRVPNEFIKEGPKTEGVPYMNVGIGFEVGPWLKDTDFGPFIELAKNHFGDMFGIRPDDIKPRMMKLSDLYYINQETHENLKSARKVLKKDYVNPEVALVHAKKQIEDLKRQVKGLEALVRFMEGNQIP